MEKIYKYLIDNQDKYVHEQNLRIPYGSRIISCTEQRSLIAVYAAVNVSQPIEVDVYIPFRVVGTGVPIPEDNHEYTFLGTVKDGGLVWHVFYKKP